VPVPFSVPFLRTCPAIGMEYLGSGNSGVTGLEEPLVSRQIRAAATVCKLGMIQ
jgi:hypothetical protein